MSSVLQSLKQNLSQRIISILNISDEPMNVDEVAKRLLENYGFVNDEEFEKAKGIVSNRLSNLFSTRKIIRSNKRVGRTFKYTLPGKRITNLRDTDEIRREQESLNKAVRDGKNAKENIMKLIPMLSAHDIAEVMFELTTAQCDIATNAEEQSRKNYSTLTAMAKLLPDDVRDALVSS